MPLPTPKKGETRQAFVERFMKSNAAKEFPTQKQRLAVAYQQYRGKKEISEPPTITKRIVGGLLMAGAI